MNSQSSGEQSAARLYCAETAIDRALVETANLAAQLPTARTDAYLSATTGQKAFDGVAVAISALTIARQNMIQTHATLGVLVRSMGLDTLAVGPLDKPGDGPPVGGGISDNPESVNIRLTDVVNKSLPGEHSSC